MGNPDDSRPDPDPDALLLRLQEQDVARARGRLRIYFGANAGVGKTYAMLSAAQQAHQAGREVLIGVVETHGRKETAALLHGLEQLPLRQLPYRGSSLPEFDLDAALALTHHSACGRAEAQEHRCDLCFFNLIKINKLNRE